MEENVTKRHNPDVNADILQADNPRRALAELLRRQGTTPKHPQNRRGADGQSYRGLIECYLATLGTLAFSVRCDPLVLPQGTDATAGPAIAATG